ncbi:PilN domain-containing protein [Timonella sp. A28]|uniref:PilN domain-containing protein n=1 Tax=Timonella sp. A28 TaxID=3442640 RepID=UPI003EBDCA3E
MSRASRSKAKSSQSPAPVGGAINYGALPQVNLLPIEIIEKRNLKELKVKIVFYLLILLVVLAAAFVFVKVEQAQAQGRYDDAVAETARLKAEELKYAEVPLVLNQIETQRAALRDGMYREVMWKEYIGAVAGTLPDDGIILDLAVEAATPNVAGPENTDGLQESSVGQLSFKVNVLTVPDTSAWIDALNEIPGFSDARFASATYEKPNGDVSYEFVGTVRITEDAYSGRFEPKTDEEVK